MKVDKQNIERIRIAGDEIGTEVFLSRDEAGALHDALGAILGRPKVEHSGCSDRMSHSSHSWVDSKGVVHLCRGLSFDRT